MFSSRFNRAIVVTRHAAQRMQERDVSATLLLEVIETGQVRHSDADRLWVWLNVKERDDNLMSWKMR